MEHTCCGVDISLNPHIYSSRTAILSIQNKVNKNSNNDDKIW